MAPQAYLCHFKVAPFFIFVHFQQCWAAPGILLPSLYPSSPIPRLSTHFRMERLSLGPNMSLLLPLSDTHLSPLKSICCHCFQSNSFKILYQLVLNKPIVSPLLQGRCKFFTHMQSLSHSGTNPAFRHISLLPSQEVNRVLTLLNGWQTPNLVPRNSPLPPLLIFLLGIVEFFLSVCPL